MATVWKHPNSPYWTAIFRDETGAWRKKSTQKENRTAAMELAIEWDRAGGLARDRHLTEVKSREIIGGLLERTTGEKLRCESVREFCTRWLKGKTDAKHEGTCTRYGTTVEKFLTFLKGKADYPITAITPADCQKFNDWLAAKKLAPASIVVEIKTLRTIFNAAFRQNLISNNPALAVELPQRIQQVERGTFTTAEVKMLYDEAAGEWKTAILIGYYGALRLGDAVSVTWENVDFEKGVLDFTVKKTGRRQIVPLHPTLRAHLESIAGDKGGPVCPELAAVTVGGRSGLSKQFLAIMRRAGISNNAVDTKGQRMLSKVSFHSLRVSFNSDLANAGVSQETRMKLTGHKSIAVNNRYTRTDIEPLRQATEKMKGIKL
jgi:integrase